MKQNYKIKKNEKDTYFLRFKRCPSFIKSAKTYRKTRTIV